MSKSEYQFGRSQANIILVYLCGVVLHASLSLCLAHDNFTVHPGITKGAASSSLGLNNFLSDSFGYGIDGPTLPSFADGEATNNPQSPIGWIMNGSVCEDNGPPAVKTIFTIQSITMRTISTSASLMASMTGENHRLNGPRSRTMMRGHCMINRIHGQKLAFTR